MTDSESKKARYDALVRDRKACRACSGLTNPSVCHGGDFDCDEIGSWSKWQGNLDAQLMLIGQDWGDVNWFIREMGCPTSWSRTNTTLVKLLGSIGFNIQLPCHSSGRGIVFLTNAILCLKEGGAQATVQKEWFQNCGVRFLRPLIDLVQPNVVVGLGEKAYRAVLNAYDLRARNFRKAVESDEPVLLQAGVWAFAVYHCGARTLNTNRNLEAQLDDWKRIGSFLTRQAG